MNFQLAQDKSHIARHLEIKRCNIVKSIYFITATQSIASIQKSAFYINFPCGVDNILQ
jgi:hypothetical protein